MTPETINVPEEENNEEDSFRAETKSQPAFTLIELIIVISVMAILFAGGIVVQTSFLEDTYLNNGAERIVQQLRLAQSRSISRFQNSAWGVYFDEDAGGTDDRVVLFKGTTYAGRDTAWDLEVDLEDAISLGSISFNGGGTDMVFTALTGATATYGSAVLTDSRGNTITLTLNSYGVIDRS